MELHAGLLGLSKMPLQVRVTFASHYNSSNELNLKATELSQTPTIDFLERPKSTNLTLSALLKPSH